MNKRLFIRWQIKKWIPLFIILMTLFILFFVVKTASSAYYPTDLYFGYAVIENSYLGQVSIQIYNALGKYLSALIDDIMPIAMASTFLIPLAVYSYRYDKKAADAFGQFPAKKGEIRRVRILVAIVMLLISISIPFWIGVLIRFINQVTFQPAVHGDVPFYFFNYGYYALFYLYMIVAVSAQFIFNCFLCSTVGRYMDSLIVMLFAELILGFGMYAILYCIDTVAEAFTDGYFTHRDELYSVGTEISAANPIRFAEIFFQELIVYGKLDEFTIENIRTADIVGWSLYPVAMLSVSPFVLFGADPSGEKYGRPGGINPFGSVVIHTAAALAGLALSCSLVPSAVYSYFALVALIFAFGFFGLVYYLLLTLYARNFKPSKANLIAYLSIMGTVFAYMVFLAIACFMTNVEVIGL